MSRLSCWGSSRGVAVFLGGLAAGSLVVTNASAQAPASAPVTADDTAPLPVPDDLTQAQPGGVTADQAGERAAQTSWNARASMENLRGAAARVDEAFAAFLPKLSTTGKYTRLSNFTAPSLFSFPGNLVTTGAGPAGAVTPAEVAAGGLQSFPANFSFPFFLVNNWLFQATLNIPISDYLFRTDQAYTAATRSQDAARWDVATARAASEANGRIAYYSWLNARGAIIVAVQSLNDQKTHLRDARNQFTAGNASKADVLRAETAMASADLVLERAKNLSDLTEKQLRVAMHAPEGEVLLPGENLDATAPPVQGNVTQMTIEALSSRPEVKSADANAASIHGQAEATKASRYPNFSAFGDGILGNPNARYVPPTVAWHATWDLGAQLTWSPNDVLSTNGSVRDLESQVAAIEANKNITRDNIEVEVTQMLQAVREADFSIETSTRELASAQEAYRVQRELFNNGRGTSTTLADAESDLTRARLDLLNAKVAARTARIRLTHALGRDVQPVR